MATATLIRTASPAGRRPLGVQGQQVIDSHRQIDAVLRSRLGAGHADLFARPERKTDGGFDWYAAWSGTVQPLSDLPPEQRAPHEADIAQKLADIRTLAAEQASRGGSGATLSEMLERATQLADTSDAYLVEGRPVLTFWGFVPEDPAHAPASFTPIGAVAKAEVAAPVAAALAAPAAGWGGWWRWLLLLLLLILLLLLALKACEPVPPVIVERPVEEEPADLAGMEERLAALRAEREEQLKSCLVPPIPRSEIPAIPTEPPAVTPPPATPPQQTPALPDLPSLPEIAQVPATPAPTRQPPAQNSCVPNRQPYEAPEVVLVVDASGSMRDSIPGAANRMQAAQRSIGQLVAGLPQDVDVGLVEFTDCSRIERDRFYSANERTQLMGRVNSLTPDRGTPLARSVERAGSVISSQVDGVVVVVTDGADSCGGDPCAAARAMASSKPNVKINVIDISGSASNPTAQCMAQATGGRVFQPNSAADMQIMVQQASEQPDIRSCR
ncbi:MAG: VWA domain-containing protein [Alphaproteobacteria bacterium]|nr:VWA domain-containing protein [Alphaproteobacteria bacterium]MBU0795939.1 VWA domain-containing protein [Alphaproteobacteria bacterium]MBU0886976.1 VWA domain-containing protein [Alphaproteobacteria bacterium]MBU1813168.1 VWA domain-containing protein [Alphaproteobacteria bacterium]